MIAMTFLMREEKDTQEKCTNKSGKAWVIFCDAFPAKPPTVASTPRSIWLMTAAIVRPCAYDLLIKFVFAPRELVRLVVQHDRCSVT